MKKFLFIASALAIVAGCAKVTTVNTEEPQEIAFKAYTNVSTKAGFKGAINGTKYPKEETFGVFAYYNSTIEPGTGWQNLDNSIRYIDDVEFVNPDDGDTWKANPSYFWPKQGSLVFAAYSPYKYYDGNKVNAGHSSTTGIYANGFTNPPYIYGQVQEQVDFMWFDVNLSLNVCSGTYQAAFKHALSNVVFNVKAKDAISAKAVRIKKITMKNVATTGNFASNNGAPSWENQGSYNDNVAFVAEKGHDISVDGEYFPNQYSGVLVIPQDVVSFEIDYQIGYGYDKDTDKYTEYIDQRYVYSPGSVTWAHGYRYTYTITLGVDEITILPSVDKWVDPTAGTDITVGGSSN